MAIGAAAQLRGPDVADPRDARRFGTHVWWGPAGQMIEGWGINEPPKHCPYRIGDWVVLHGYPGNGNRSSGDTWCHGFRGYVLGHHGSTLLSGLTDDGGPWTEHWGHLDPDGYHRCDWLWCVCCPHPKRAPKRTRVTTTTARASQQLSLFGLPPDVWLTSTRPAWSAS